MQPPNPSSQSEPPNRLAAQKPETTPNPLQDRVRELEVQNRQLQQMVAELLAKNYELRVAAASPDDGPVRERSSQISGHLAEPKF